MLINFISQQRLSEEEFRNANPNLSFPAVLTDEILLPFNCINLIYPIKPEVLRSQKVIDGGNININNLWQVKWVIVDKTPEEYQEALKLFEEEVTINTQKRLDDFAATKGYDGILSVCTYAGNELDAENTIELDIIREGNYAVRARCRTWSVLISYLNDVKKAIKPLVNTWAEIEQMLPELKWPDSKHSK